MQTFPTLNQFLPSKQIKDIKSKSTQNLCLLQNGKVLFWPFQKSSGKYIYKPVELPLPHSIMISQISCGNNFSMLLSTNGHLYSFGKENSQGQLGHNDRSPRNLPTLIEKLKVGGELIKSVSCGFKHVICKNGLGKVFVWGANDCGQLGLGTYVDELSPKVLGVEKLSMMKFRVGQVIAGFRSSMVLMEDGKIWWWGSAGGVERRNEPEELEYKNKIIVIFVLIN